MHRTLILVAAALAACQPKLRRPAGDEEPYPALEPGAVDRTVAPCQDFYQYACGRWIAETPVPADRTSLVRAQGEVEERDARLLRRILDDASAGKVEPHDRFGRKAGDFYAACMDEGNVDARGRAELQAEWARLEAIGDRGALADELSRLTAMGIAVPYSVRAGVDPDDPRRAVLALEAGGLGLPGPERYLAEERDAALLRQRYAEHVRKELALVGVAPGEIHAFAAGAVGLGRALALERALAAARQAGQPAPARVDRAALQDVAPGFPWERLLRTVGGGRARISLAEPGFAAALGRLFLEAPLDQWKAYLRWRLAETLADERALPAAAVDERLRFVALLEPTPEPRPRWKHCVDLTGRTLSIALGTSFGRRYLGAAGREQALRITSAVESGMVAAIDGAPWVDRTTSARAGEKLQRLDRLVGYPDAGPDYDKLRVSRTSFLRNVLSARRFAVAREVARAERPVDRSEWLASPLAAAPSYSAERNALGVPAGALQPPSWIRDAPDPVTYGALGTEIGRALAGVVQGAGRWRGSQGEAGDWWSPDAARQFAPRAACVDEQYEAFQAEVGGPPAGPRTLPANLADLAGLRAAYEAMRTSRPAGGDTSKFLGFTPDQQFFLAFAQSLCAVSIPEVGGAEVPARFRVNGPLSNFPEFAKAFRCEAGSAMARPAAARCDVW